MKGLILKDIYNVRFQIIGGLLLLLPPCIEMLIAGKVSGTASDDFSGLLGLLIYGMINYLIITVCSSFFLNTISNDIKSGWAKMQLTMPVSHKEIIGGKLAATGIILGLLTIFTLISNILGVIFFDRSLELMITMPIVLALLQMAVLSVTIVLGYRLRGNITAVYIIVILIIAAGIFALIYGFFTNIISVSAIRWIAYGGVSLLSAIVIVSCYNLGSKAVEDMKL